MYVGTVLPSSYYLQKTVNKYTGRERIDLRSVVFCRNEIFLLVFGYFEKHSHLELTLLFQRQALLKIVWFFSLVNLHFFLIHSELNFVGKVRNNRG